MSLFYFLSTELKIVFFKYLATIIQTATTLIKHNYKIMKWMLMFINYDTNITSKLHMEALQNENEHNIIFVDKA